VLTVNQRVAGLGSIFMPGPRKSELLRMDRPVVPASERTLRPAGVCSTGGHAVCAIARVALCRRFSVTYAGGTYGLAFLCLVSPVVCALFLEIPNPAAHKRVLAEGVESAPSPAGRNSSTWPGLTSH